MRRFRILVAVFVFLSIPAGVGVRAADRWVSADDPAVSSNNDCGHVSDVLGEPLIRRSFQDRDQQGSPVHVADRVSAGDELSAPAGTRLEWTTGSNLIVVMGPGARVRLGGLRSFAEPSGAAATRLDVELLAGDLRVQARRNADVPEYLLVSADGGEILVDWGDVVVSSEGAWRGAVLYGEASARMRRGAVTGAPFPMPEGFVSGFGAQERLAEAAADAMRARLPFSFELARLALPPLPAAGRGVEAP